MSDKRDNSGTLGRNPDKTPEHDNWPDHKGKASVTCPHCHKSSDWWLSAWVKTGSTGKFFSIAFKPKEAQAARSAPAQEPAGDFQDDEPSDIPF